MIALAVGMYVRLPGGSLGRIVDRRVRDGVLWWLVKLANGELLEARTDKITPR